MKRPASSPINKLKPLPAYGSKGRATIEKAGKVGADVGTIGGTLATTAPVGDGQSVYVSPLTVAGGFVGRKVGRAVGKGVGAMVNLTRNVRQDRQNKKVLKATRMSPERQEMLRKEQFYK